MPEPTRSLIATPLTASIADPNATTGGEPSAAPLAPPVSPSRYVLGDEIARGGMGEVYRATDAVLNREVAVKVLQPKYHPEGSTARRFHDEARITAQLQHPGIPAVHDLGTLPDGRPFLAMKLIKGQTLDDLLKTRLSPADDRGRFVAIFEQISHALAYAHAHGVIHRDLKPTNVMVGAFNEVQVMDWGLAKVLGERRDVSPPVDPTDPDATADPDPTEIKSLRDSDDLRTQAGSILGTPAYMAPEQAIGAVDKIDRRTDVFGLGALLAVILTGKPPFAAESSESSRQMAAMGKVADCLARLDASGAEPELAALCKRCLSPEPENRPANAEEVATAVAALRAAADDRARRAEIDRERATVQAAEQTKRRRVVQWAGGITAGVLLAGVVGTSVGLVQAEGRRVEADHARQAEKNRADERDKAYAKTADVLDAMVSDLTEDSLATQKAITEEQRKFLTEVRGYYREFAAAKREDETTRAWIARAAFRVGSIEDRLGRTEEGAAAFRQARYEYAALAADFPAVPDYRGGLARSHNRLGILLKDLGQRAEAEHEYRKALALGDRLATDFPAVPEYRADLAKFHINLGNLFLTLGQWAEAEQEYRRALDLRAKLAADFPAVPAYRSELALSHTNLGLLLADLGKTKEAEGQYRKALALRAQLATDFPAVPEYRSDLASSHLSLGVVLQKLGKRAEAEEEYRKALTLRENLATDFPAVPNYRSELAGSHNNLGLLLADLGKGAEAEEEYRTALALQEKLVADFPAVPRHKIDLGGGYSNFGNLVSDGGKLAESLAWYEKAIATLRPVHEAEPRDVTAREFLRNSHWNRAMAYDEMKKYTEAVKDWDRAIELSLKDDQPRFRASRTLSRVNAGQVAEAVAEAAELRKLPGWKAWQLYNFACVYSVASAKITDETLNYADRAMEILGMAVKGGFKDVARLQADKNLDPLREREDFKKLVAELEAKFPPKKEVLPPPRADK